MIRESLSGAILIGPMLCMFWTLAWAPVEWNILMYVDGPEVSVAPRPVLFNNAKNLRGATCTFATAW
jgi:hypothetical protein